MNENEVLDFVRLTKDYSVHVRFIEFMPFNGNDWNKDQVISFRNLLSDLKNDFDIIKLNDLPNSTSKSYKAIGHSGTFSFITTITQPFCNECNRIRLTADGKLRNCLFSMEEMDLLTPLRNNEEISKLIIQNISDKKIELGGLGSLQKLETNRTTTISKRGMYAIGG